MPLGLVGTGVETVRLRPLLAAYGDGQRATHVTFIPFPSAKWDRYRLNYALHPQNPCAESSALWNVTVFGETAFKDIIKL